MPRTRRGRVLLLATSVAALALTAVPNAQAGWAAAATLSAAGADASDPQVAISPNGAVVQRAWRAFDGTNWRIATGNTCSGPCYVSPAGVDAADPDAAATNAGGVVVWEASAGADTRIQASLPGCAGTPFLTAPGATSIDPVVAANADGDIVIAWRRLDGAHYRAGMRFVPRGTCTPTTAVLLSASGRDATNLRVGINHDGDAVAGWQRFDGTYMRVQARIRAADGALSSVVPITGTIDALDPRIGIADDGTVVALWRVSDGTSMRVRTRARAPGGALSPAQNLSNAGASAEAAELAVNGTGDSVAVWKRSDGTNLRVQLRARTALGTLSGIATLSASGFDAAEPTVGMDGAGNAVVGWTRLTSTDDRVVARTRSANGALGRPVVLSPGGGDADSPEVAVAEVAGAAGAAAAVWRRFDGSHFRAQSSTHTNQEPTDLALSNATVAENEEAGTAVGTFSTTDGDSVQQAYTYTLVPGDGATDNGLFTIASGQLKTAASFNFEEQASYSIRVRTTDDGLPPKSFEKPFTILISDVNDPPTAADDAYSGAVGNTLARRGVTVVGEPSVALAPSTLPLANDSDEDGDPITIVAETVASAGGGTATINADGSFTFLPGVGDKDQTDTFTYQVTDGEASTPATVSVSILNGLVWYVNKAAAAGGDGRSNAPFDSLTPVNGAGGAGDSDGPSDVLFLYGHTYAGGLALEPSQPLYGRRHGLVVAGKTILGPGGFNAVITGGLALSTDNGVQGINLGNAVGAALRGSTVGTASVNTATDGSISNATGKAIEIDGGALTLELLSASGTGIALTDVTGSVQIPAGTLASAGTELAITGGTADVAFGGTITSSAGTAVDIRNHTGGAVALTGAITVTSGGGVSLTDNTGSSVSFSGPVQLSTGAARAFGATGGGTVTVAGTSNTLSTTTGPALVVQNTTIGAGGLTFRSINVSGDDVSPAGGIVLQSTGTLGSLTVTGNSSGFCGGQVQPLVAPDETDCTGGTIEGTGSAGAGIFLNGTKDPSFSRINVKNNRGSGIRATSVPGLSISNSLVQGNGSMAGGSQAGIFLSNPVGVSALTNSTVSGSFEDNIRVSKPIGFGTLSITGATVGPTPVGTGGHGLTLRGEGSGNLTVNVSGSDFSGNQGAAVVSSFSGASKLTADLGTTRFANNNMAVQLATVGDADLTADIHNNASILGSKTNAIQVLAGASSTVNSKLRVKVRSNTIGEAATVDSGARDLIGIAVEVNDDADAIVSVTDNTIRHTDQEGIFVQARDPDTTDPDPAVALLDLTLRGNVVQSIDDNSAFPLGTIHGTRIESRHGTTVCLDIAGNTSTAVGAAQHFRLRQRDSSAFQLERFTGSGTDDAAVAAFVAGSNAAGSTASATHAASYTGVADGACRKP